VFRRVSAVAQSTHTYNKIPLTLVSLSRLTIATDVARSAICCVTFAQSEPYCRSILFVCLDVCRSFRGHLQPTMIDRSQPNLVGRYIPVLGPVSAFLDPSSPILSVPEGKICAYSCHCERDTSCHMTCLSVCLSDVTLVSPAKTTELIKMTRLLPRNHNMY